MSPPEPHNSALLRPLPVARRPMTLGRVLLLCAALGMIAWFTVRVRAAQGIRDTQAAERQRTAEAERKAAAAPKRPMATLRGVPGTWLPAVPIVGTLSPVREADLGFKVSGRLQSIRVRLGQSVQQGALLAALDSSESLAAIDSADAQVRASQAQLLLAQDAERRSTTLLVRGAGTAAAGIQASQQSALTAAQLDAARAQRRLAEVNLHNLSLTAPFAGFVTKVPGGTGVIVSPGVPLFHVQDTTTLKLSGTVGETDARLVRPGARVVLRGEGGQSVARPIVGFVTAVLPAVDPATRRVPVEAEMPNADGALLGGSFVRATIEGGAPLSVLRLPGAALRPGSQDEIMVIDKGRLSARHITWAPDDQGALLVRAGLSADEAVLLSPSAEAHDGDAVPGDAAAGSASTGASPASTPATGTASAEARP